MEDRPESLHHAICRNKPALRVPLGLKVAEAEGRLAVWMLLVIVLTVRVAWPLSFITAIALGWLSPDILVQLAAILP